MPEETPAGSRRLRDWLEILSFVAVIGGVLVGFSEHFSSKAREASDAAETVYDNLDDEYRNMLALRIAHPRMDRLIHIHGPLPADTTPDDRAQVRSYYSLVIDLLERAYLGYHDERLVSLVTDSTRAQWAGWQDSLDRNLRSPEFVATWRDIGTGFDVRFQAYVNGRLAAASTDAK